VFSVNVVRNPGHSGWLCRWTTCFCGRFLPAACDRVLHGSELSVDCAPTCHSPITHVGIALFLSTTKAQTIKAQTMKKDEYRRWFSHQLSLQNRLLIGAITAMIGLGLVATLMEATVFAVILHIGFIPGGWTPSFVVAFGIMGAILFFIFLRLPKQLGDALHEVERDDGVTIIHTAPTMTAVWTYALGSLETDQTRIERLLGLLALPQRLFCAAYVAWQRMGQLKLIDIDDCSAVIRLLHRKAERVEVSELIQELQLPNLAVTLRNLSLIDGVMFLTRKSVGLSLTNRLVENMDRWEEKHKVAD